LFGFGVGPRDRVNLPIDAEFLYRPTDFRRIWSWQEPAEVEKAK